MIKWTKGDAIRLGRAIAEFNRAIKELENEINKLYIPNTREYKQLKESIISRAELNRVIRSMKRFSSSEDSAALVTTESGEVLTRWEKKELSYARASALRRVNAELKKIETAEKPYRSDKQKDLEQEIQDLRDLFTFTGDKFDRKRNILLKKASYDYQYHRNLIYKTNYLNVIKRDYKEYDNYQILIDYMEKQDPSSFYLKSQSIGELDDLTLLSDQILAQNKFNRFVELWIGQAPEDIQDTQEDEIVIE